MSAAPVVPKDPSPIERQKIVIFIIGGISPVEISQIQREIQNSLKDTLSGDGMEISITLASNNLISPIDLFEQIYP